MAHYRNASLNATAVLVNGAACAVQWLNIDNTMNTAKSFLQLYDAAATSDVTVGTTTPTYTLVIPGSGAYDTALGDRDRHVFDFKNGIVAAATTTITGNTNPGTAIMLNLDSN